MAEQSLWPKKFDPVSERVPADLLEMQAKSLEDATHGKLIGRVEVGSQGDKISLNFVIVAPSLGGYQYRLFQVLHGVYPSYPAKIVLNMSEQRNAADEQAFTTQLAQILQSPPTRNVLAELLALVSRAEQQTKAAKTKRTA